MGKKIWLYIRPRNFGSRVNVGLSTHPSAAQGNQCEISHFHIFLASMGTCNLSSLNLINDIPRMGDWQLSKQVIHWPESCDHICRLKCQLIKVTCFYEVFRWPVISFKLIAGSSLCFSASAQKSYCSAMYWGDKLQYVISWLHSSATPRNYLVSL